MQREGGLATALGTVDLGDAASRDAADAERQIEGDTAGGDGVDGHRLAVAQLHDRALAKLPLDLRHRQLDRSLALCHVGTSLNRVENMFGSDLQAGMRSLSTGCGLMVDGLRGATLDRPAAGTGSSPARRRSP